MKADNVKKSFILYADYDTHFDMLSIEERGKLITAIFKYHNKGDIPNFSGGLKMLFSVIKKQLDRDSEKYDSICERNRLNGAKGGRPNKKPDE